MIDPAAPDIQTLVRRLTAARGEDILLSGAVLEWLRGEPGFHVPGETGWRQPALPENARWLRHNRILVGDVGAARSLLRDLFPDAAYQVGNLLPGAERESDEAAPGSTIVAARVHPFGESSPGFEAWSRDEGAALLAATLRAYEAVHVMLTAAPVPVRSVA